MIFNGVCSKKILTVIAGYTTFMLVLCGGCGGGNGDDPGSSNTESPVFEELMKDANIALQTGDVKGALEDYASAIEIDSGDSTARFGHALCNMMLLAERDPITAILTGFGDGPWAVSTVFGSDGYLETNDPLPLPFYSLKECTNVWPGTKRIKWRCLLGNTISGYNVDDIITSLVAVEPYLDTIIDDLVVSIEDPDASYTILKELYNGSDDIPINHADMVQILAGMYGIKAGIDLADSWNFDMDLSDMFDSEGNAIVTKAEVVEQLNQAFTLKNNHRLEYANDNLQYFFTYSKQALGEVLEGATNGILDLSDENRQLFHELYNLVDAGVTSLSNGETTVPHVQPDLVGDLKAFFHSPPDANAIIEYDPFVVEGGKIKAVEAFWQEMIQLVCNYDLNNRPNFEIFSEAVRNLAHPYRLLFDEIIGHYFGGHYVGGRSSGNGAGGGTSG